MRPMLSSVAMATALLLAGCRGSGPQVGQVQIAAGSTDAVVDTADLLHDGPTQDGSGDLLLDGSAGDGALDSGPACGLVSAQGCCSGQVLWWCADGVLKQIDCSNKPSCGWSNSGFYDCNTSGAADPSGATSLDCSGLLPDGGAAGDGGPDGATGPCGSIGNEGCCDGTMLKYCRDGVLKTVSCAINPSCGWFPMGQYYDCGTGGGADPLGIHAKVCPSSTPSDAVADLFPSPDVVDAFVDGGDGGGGGDGCSCQVVGGGAAFGVVPLLLVLGLLICVKRPGRR